MATEYVYKTSAMASLSMLRQNFVNEYLVDMNATQAAVRAGYSEATARTQGSRLLQKVDIQAALAEVREARQKRTEIDQDWIIEHLVENVEKAAQAMPVLDNQGKPTGEYRYDGAVVNRGLELLGKHNGMFSDELEVSAPIRHRDPRLTEFSLDDLRLIVEHQRALEAQ